MYKKRELELLIFSMVFLFIISGCGSGGDGISLQDPFLGGTQGLEIGFLKDSPPEEVTDGGGFPFQALVSIKNQGEHNLVQNNVRVDLTGIRASNFGVVKADITNLKPDADPTARKKDSEGNIIDAVETIVTIPGNSKNFNFGADLISGNTDYRFRANVCYNYQTNAIAQICVLKSLINVDDNAICDPKGSKQIFSSASPVQVTGFKQTVVGEDKIQFSFDVIHSGSGEVFKQKTITFETDTSQRNGCPTDSGGRRSEENKVVVDVNTGLGTALDCGIVPAVANENGHAAGEVKLVNGRKTIVCTQTLQPSTSRQDFEKTVDVRVDFNYFDSIEKRVLVKHIGGPLPTPLAPGGLPACTGNNKCKSQSCGNYDSCSDASASCTCPSGNPCAGTCTPKVGQGDGDAEIQKCSEDTDSEGNLIGATTCRATCNNFADCKETSICGCESSFVACIGSCGVPAGGGSGIGDPTKMDHLCEEIGDDEDGLWCDPNDATLFEKNIICNLCPDVSNRGCEPDPSNDGPFCVVGATSNANRGQEVTVRCQGNEDPSNNIFVDDDPKTQCDLNPPQGCVTTRICTCDPGEPYYCP
jgi:hypothetical protein